MIKQYQFNGKPFFFIQLNITDDNGKRHQPKFKTDKNGNRISSKHSAKKLEVEYYSNFMSKLKDDFSNLSFTEWHTKFLSIIKLSYKRSTYMQYDGDIRKWISHEILESKLTSIRKSDVHTLIYETLPMKGASPHTQKRILKSLRRIFEAAVEEGYLAKNPAQGIKVKVPPPKKLVLNTDEVMHFLENAKAIKHPFYYHWSIALLTGMRNGELFALRWSDIDMVTKNICISASWSNKDGYHSTKANKNRICPISSDLYEL
jgi:integrase